MRTRSIFEPHHPSCSPHSTAPSPATRDPNPPSRQYVLNVEASDFAPLDHHGHVGPRGMVLALPVVRLGGGAGRVGVDFDLLFLEVDNPVHRHPGRRVEPLLGPPV